MCYRNSSSVSAKQLESRYGAVMANPDDYQPSYHTSSFAAPRWPIIMQQSPIKIDNFIWGLIPTWSRDEEQATELCRGNANARSESVFDKPSFRDSILERRCLVASTGFFEFKEVKGKKYPYFIHLAGTEIFSFAGLYSSWTDRSTGEMFNSFSILTRQADAFMADIHNTKKRMPVILPQSLEKEWLNPDLTKKEIEGFFKDYNLKLEAHTVSKLLLSSVEDTNVEAVQKKVSYENV